MQYEYTAGVIADDVPKPMTSEFQKLQSLDYKPLRSSSLNTAAISNLPGSGLGTRPGAVLPGTGLAGI
jgi:hypothetical protein